jgi:hypothetical protein
MGLVAPNLTAKGGNIVFRLAAKEVDLKRDEEKEIPVTAVVSPLLTARGKLTGTITARRGSQDIAVPVTLMVANGAGNAALLCTPAKVSLDARPGELQSFRLEVKLAPQGPEADEAKVVASFKDAKGRPAEVLVALGELKAGAKLSCTQGVIVSIKIAAPEQPGVYTGALTVSSVHAGSVEIPIALTVKEGEKNP